MGSDRGGRPATTPGSPPEWDPLLFAGAARYYERGRLPYPPGIAEAIKQAAAPTSPACLLDVGCGPGSIALRVAETFGEVVGIDPDPDMIDEARRLARERHLHNVRFLRLRAEDLPATFGPFDVVAFAASFRWMDRPRVVRLVRQLLSSTGIAATIGGGWYRALPAPESPLPSPPWAAIAELVRSFLGSEPRAGSGMRWADPTDFETVWARAGFYGPERIEVPDGRVLERTIDDIVAGTFSQSSSAPHLFGTRLERFRTELFTLLKGAAPEGRFAVRMGPTPMNVWRPASPGVVTGGTGE